MTVNRRSISVPIIRLVASVHNNMQQSDFLL